MKGVDILRIYSNVLYSQDVLNTGHDDGMLNDPLTEREITNVFDSKAQDTSLSSQLLILYYVLLYEDSVLNHMKTLGWRYLSTVSLYT